MVEKLQSGRCPVDITLPVTKGEFLSQGFACKYVEATLARLDDGNQAVHYLRGPVWFRFLVPHLATYGFHGL
jgi:hypothetical protein